MAHEELIEALKILPNEEYKDVVAKVRAERRARGGNVSSSTSRAYLRSAEKAVAKLLIMYKIMTEEGAGVPADRLAAYKAACDRVSSVNIDAESAMVEKRPLRAPRQ